MKFEVSRNYIFYSFYRNILILAIFSIVLLVANVFDFNKWFKIVFLTIVILIVLKIIIDLILFKRYKKNNYILFEENKLIFNSNTFFTINFNEVIIPTKNILHYGIVQNIVLKKLNLYRIDISCGSHIEDFYFTEENAKFIESFLKNNIIKNSVLLEGERV